MHLFVSAGEPSGDQHGAALIRALHGRLAGSGGDARDLASAETPRRLRVSGFGGPEMRQAGQEQLFQLTDLAVMGVAAVLPVIGKFWGLYQRAKAHLKATRPDAVVLIDFPGFHWHIARAAKSLGIPVHYYMPPQLWAWAPWRIRKLRRTVDTVISGLPFEADWYESRGVCVARVPHPFFDEVAHKPLDASHATEMRAAPGRVVAVLPGSRTGEVDRNFPVQLEVMRRVGEAHPDVRFQIACYRAEHAETCRRMLAEECSQHGAMPMTVPPAFQVGRTSEVLEAAEMAVMVSGSVSLEVLARRVPAVVCYRLALTSLPLIPMVTAPFMSLPNLIAGREMMPEHAFAFRRHRRAAAMAAVLKRWLGCEDELRAVRDQLAAVASDVDHAGGADKAAAAVLCRINVAASAPTDQAARAA